MSDDVSFGSEVSDVNPDELEKILASVDLSIKPVESGSVQKPSNLKSAASRQSTSGPAARKVHFTPATESGGRKSHHDLSTDDGNDDDDDDLADLLALDRGTSSNPPAVLQRPITSSSTNSDKITMEAPKPLTSGGQDLARDAERKPTSSRRVTSNFMSELFGPSSGDERLPDSSLPQKGFVLDDKYKKATTVDPILVNNPSAVSVIRPSGRRRTGSATLGSELDSSSLLPDPAKVAHPATASFKAAPSITASQSSAAVVLEKPTQSGNMLQELKAQMADFEQGQEQQLERDLDRQTEAMNSRLKMYEATMEQQKSAVSDQLQNMQQYQATLLKQHQHHIESVCKQIQAQMESEMRLKSDLIRNQLSLMIGLQNQAALPDMQVLLGQNVKADPDLEDRVRKRMEHDVEDLEARIRTLKDRIASLQQQHVQELEAERERRLREVKALREEHREAEDALKADYLAAMDKIKELKAEELAAARDGVDASKALKLLLDQVTNNTSDLDQLQTTMQGSLSGHVEVREALLRQKDEQIKGLQAELQARISEQEAEQKRTQEASLQREEEWRRRDAEWHTQNSHLMKLQCDLDSEKRIFHTEKELSLAGLRDQQAILEQQKRQLQKERQALSEAVQQQHQQLISRKAELELGQRLREVRPHEAEGPEAQLQMDGMIEAVRAEWTLLEAKSKSVSQAKADLKKEQERVRAAKKAMFEAAKALARVAHDLDLKFQRHEGLQQQVEALDQASQKHLEECRRVAQDKQQILEEAEHRLAQVEQAMQMLELKRDQVSGERQRLLATRRTTLCSRCSHPLADWAELHKSGLTNLGVRTAGDGQVQRPMAGWSVLSDWKQTAKKDDDFLQREHEYLKSLCG